MIELRTYTAYALAGLIAAAIIFIGARFLVAPRAAAAGYGVQPDLGQPSVGAYLSVKGIRDIASGLFVVVLMAAGQTQLLGWVLLAATIIPIADAIIVLRNGGANSIAYGVHGATAVVMLVTAALLLI
ncbi:hypothetical protein A5724_24855 [Mycobacterium sp. ACS1612]|uniref:DUF4267 domain-containing protein n=1 Tax=Mycobacterium sp. ACS1612 TaxID=1834117 RepID=UPI0007FC7B13|nr:DUF4267 domain-containing protein [Mycobacterium sp. ACS1612]OBF30069.1 hypothetical protein A5724_24855 [Mycobacterium sp. ACS1612]